MAPFRIIWHSLQTLYEELFHFFLMGCVTLAAMLLVLPGPFALAGLWGVAQKAVRGQGIQWSDYWEALRRYGPRNFLNALVALLVYGMLALNLWFYNTPEVSPVSGNLALALTVISLGVTLIWTGMVFYWLSFQLEMLDPRFWLSLRNSLYLALARPLHTLILLSAAGLATALSVAIPLLLILLPSFIAVLSLTSLRELLLPLLQARQTA